MARPVPWWPEALATGMSLAEPRRVGSAGGSGALLAADLSYLLVEELAGSVAVLQRWAWPRADTSGRLVWPDAAPIEEVVVPLALLRWQLYETTTLERHPRPGDVFAVRWVGTGTTEPVRDLAELFVDVYDVSADAREAAKLAYGAALVEVPEAVEADVGAAEVGAAEVGAAEVGAADAGPRASRLDDAATERARRHPAPRLVLGRPPPDGVPT